jgi:hypothetical protein
MELRLNKEGVQYVLNLPDKDVPGPFPQVVFFPSELEWPSPEVTITDSSSLTETQRTKKEIRDRRISFPLSSDYKPPGSQTGREKLVITEFR